MLQSKFRTLAALGVLLAALFAAPGHALADRATEMKARESFAAGRYDEALSLFAKLYAETLHPVYLRNIGRCHQKMREPQKAIDAFRDYLAKAKKVSPDERAEVDGYIKEMEALKEEQAKAAAQTPPPPPVVTPAPPLPANPPTTLATNAGPSAGLAATQPAPSQPNLLVSQPAPADDSKPFYKTWWFWTGVGVVAAGAVVTAIVLSSGVERPECSAEICK